MPAEVSILLLQFRVKNYRSIGDEIVIDLTAGSGREHKDFLFDENGVGVLPVVSLYGANASGKSNVFEAMIGMFYNVRLSHLNGNNKYFNAVPFLFNDQLRNEPTECEIFFKLGINEYQYGYKSTRAKVIEEWLYYRKHSKRETVSKPIFERTEDELQFFGTYKNLERYRELLNHNALILSVLGNRTVKETVKSETLFFDIIDWINTNLSFSLHHMTNNDSISSLYYDEKLLVNNFLSFIQEFDPSIQAIDIKKEENESGTTKFEVYTKHNNKFYPLRIESDGTKKLFKLFIAIHLALTYKSITLLFDELDTHLHPLILRRIVSMFHDKEQNIMKSQLIFSSHNLTLLNRNEMRRDEIWFVEKDERGFTRAYSLDSFKTSKEEVRADLDYGKHYLAGRFGAIPYLNSGKKD